LFFIRMEKWSRMNHYGYILLGSFLLCLVQCSCHPSLRKKITRQVGGQPCNCVENSIQFYSRFCLLAPLLKSLFSDKTSILSTQTTLSLSVAFLQTPATCDPSLFVSAVLTSNIHSSGQLSGVILICFGGGHFPRQQPPLQPRGFVPTYHGLIPTAEGGDDRDPDK